MTATRSFLSRLLAGLWLARAVSGLTMFAACLFTLAALPWRGPSPGMAGMLFGLAALNVLLFALTFLARAAHRGGVPWR